jgi:chemotaxis regulatin CheY-phosphate phosphatase CheZ
MPTNQGLQAKIQREIEDLAGSIGEIVAKFKELHNPLKESSEKVPRATEQLDKISEQTEAATHQMLDQVEKIVQHVEDSKTGLNQIKTCISEDRVRDVNGVVNGLIEKANVTCNDAYTIMDALQFQDITAQQMSHAASLLEDIEHKLHSIMAVLKGSRENTPAESANDKKGRVYDPHADLFEKKTDQSAIDDIFAKKT